MTSPFAGATLSAAGTQEDAVGVAPDATAPLRPQQSPAVSALSLDDDLVLCGADGQRAYVLNRSGTEIWSLCDGQHTVEDIAEEVAAGYAIPYERALTDVMALVVHLGRTGLLAAHDRATREPA